jgi:hypothetical protein
MQKYHINTKHMIKEINTHYIHSVVVQDFASGRVCCVNQYHYQSRKRRVVMRLVHATGKTLYKVLYQHTMYVISLSNISIKTSFKQIARIELKCAQYSEGDYILWTMYVMGIYFLYHMLSIDMIFLHMYKEQK